MSDAGSSPTAADSGVPRVRLALLDDHEVLLDSLSSWIEANAPDFDLVLSASTWLQLVHSDNFPTDLVFIDFQLKEPVSIEARVRTCRAAGAKVIVLSSLDSQESRDRAHGGGSGGVPDEVASDARGHGHRAQGHGRRAQCEHPARPATGSGRRRHEVTRPKLSAGELDALKLYVAGYSTEEVAAQLNVRYETAKTYLRRVREKYAKVNRPAGKKADLIRRAAEDGYLH